MRAATLGALTCLALACAGWLWSRPGTPAPVRTPPPPSAPAPAPLPAVPEAAARAPESKEVHPEAAPAPLPAAPDAALKDLLARIAPPELLKRRPDLPERLAALLAQHPGDDEWEAGAVAYLLHDLQGAALLEAWTNASDLFPKNGLIADACLRTACEQGPQDALLRKLADRDPDWPLPRWLLASSSLERGDAEGAERLLLSSSGLPDGADRSGLAERGSLRVREALDGTLDPPAVFGTLYGIRLGHLNPLHKLSKGLGGLASGLDAQGVPERAQALLEAGDAMGRTLSGGSRFLIGHLVGTGLESRTLEALEARARARGDLARQEACAKRLEEVRGRREQTRRWMREEQDPVTERLERMSERAGFESVLPQNWAECEARLPEEDRRFVRDLVQWHMSASEMQAYRAWLALQPQGK